MTPTPQGDPPPEVTAADLEQLRAAMYAAEPNWTGELAVLLAHCQALLPLCAGSVQAAAAEHFIADYERRLAVWHRLADRFFAGAGEASRAAVPPLE